MIFKETVYRELREGEYIQILNFCPKKSKPTGGVAPSWSESVTKHHAPFLLLAKKVVAFDRTRPV